MSLDVGPAIRSAIIAQQVPALQPVATAIVNELAQWQNRPCVFAFRPSPADAPDPQIIINPDVSLTDADALVSRRPIVRRDIAVYGKRGAPGDPADQTPKVERVGYALRELFHRQRFSMQPDGYSVISLEVAGPYPAPVDDDQTVGRFVSLTIWLRRTA